MFLNRSNLNAKTVKTFTRRTNIKLQRFTRVWDSLNLRWGIGVFSAFSGALSQLEFLRLRFVLKQRFKNSLKLNHGLCFTIPKKIKPKASRMGKGVGGFNYLTAAVRKNQQVCSLYGLDASVWTNKPLFVYLNDKTSVKLFNVRKFIRWVD